MSTDDERRDSERGASVDDEIAAEQAAVELPDRQAMSVIDPASLVSSGTLTDPTASDSMLNSPPSGAAIPGIGTLGVSGLPRPSLPTAANPTG